MEHKWNATEESNLELRNQLESKNSMISTLQGAAEKINVDYEDLVHRNEAFHKEYKALEINYSSLQKQFCSIETIKDSLTVNCQVLNKEKSLHENNYKGLLRQNETLKDQLACIENEFSNKEVKTMLNK